MALSHAMRRRGADGVVVVQSIALLPPMAVMLWLGGLPLAGILAVSLGVVLFWDIVFATARHRPFRPYGVTTAAIFSVFVPPEIPMWHLVVVLSLGTIVGELVFGGRGFSFLSPAAVALALGLLSLPDLALSTPSPMLAFACIPGALLLLAFGLLSLQVAIPFFATLAVISGAVTAPDIAILITATSFGLVFLICDPTTTATTGLGRVLHGSLAAGLVWLFGSATSAEAIVFASLMASLFAPLLDHAVVAAISIWRQRRYG